MPVCALGLYVACMHAWVHAADNVATLDAYTPSLGVPACHFFAINCNLSFNILSFSVDELHTHGLRTPASLGPHDHVVRDPHTIDLLCNACACIFPCMHTDSYISQSWSPS